jgi:tetratricopeptide (TPR) repeat protein/nucleoside phosphorylase
MSSPTGKPFRRAVILTALRVEYEAVRAHLTEVYEETHSKGNVYERGIFSVAAEQWEVGIVEVGEGTARAAQETDRAIAHFEPSVAFFVGVAGGVKDVGLGDVVVATKVYGYESGKAEAEFLPRPDVGNSTFRMQQRAKAEARKNDWLRRLGAPLSSPPRVFVAPIAAGEKVVASTQSATWQFLRHHYGDALAVEMEGRGFLQAAFANPDVEAVVVRGISDLIDKKGEADAGGSQAIASRHASAFAFEMLAKWAGEARPVEPDPLPVAPPVGHHFICYSSVDATELAFQLADALQAGPPAFRAWVDQRESKPGLDWDEQLADAIRGCDSLIFLMTRDSVTPHATCKQEWTRALKYKKPIIPLLFHTDAEMPFRLEPRNHLDFTGAFDPALKKLREHLVWLATPAGILRNLQDRLAVANRDLKRSDDSDKSRIQTEIEQLEKQIAEQERLVKDPKGAAKRTEQNIASGLERERQPEKPVSGAARSKFINPPPGVAPTYFQDRYIEMQLIGEFLKDESKRLLTVVGRGGTGKTALVCRILKALEGGQMPDDLGPLSVDGIVYLSAVGSRRLTVPNLWADLSQLLPDEKSKELDALYKDPHVSVEAKLSALLAALPAGRVALLLDNFEDVIDPTTHAVRDAELDEALRSLLNLPHHAVKVILTTRIAPRALALIQPGRQSRIVLDAGLESPHAENVLRAMDADGKAGLKTAPDELLGRAREYTLGYPRALEALFGILSVDRYTTLPELLAAPPPENVVEALVGEAYSRLNPTAQKVMQALAVYDRPVTPAAVDYLLQPYEPGVDSAPVLNRLVNMHFARKEAGRYYLHPVDRAYAFERIPKEGLPSPFQGEGTGKGVAPWTQLTHLQRGAEYFKHARKPRAEWKSLEDLSPQLAEFDLRCACGEHDTAGWVLREIDFDYLLLWGHYQLMIKLHEQLLGKISDPDLRQISIGNLGSAYYSIGQVQEAIVCYEQALASAREMKYRQSESVWLGGLGNAYSDLGQTARAIEYYEQALAIAREIGDRRNESTWLGNLGNRYGELGQTARAIDYYEQALAIAREVGNRGGEGRHLGNLGNRYAELGQTARAIEYQEQALAIDREIEDRRGEGSDLVNLGNSYAELGQTARAIEYYEQALAIDREIGDRRGEGIDLGNLAEALIDEGRYAEAIQRSQEYVKIGEEIGKPGTYSYGRLASACLYAGDLPAARAAVETARKYDEPQNNHNVSALLGVIALRQNDKPTAQEAFMTAVAQAEALLVHTPQFYDALDSKALALCGLGVCVSGFATASRQQIEEAKATYRAARAINKDAGVVKRVLRLLDALAVMDTEGVLAGVRSAAAGE